MGWTITSLGSIAAPSGDVYACAVRVGAVASGDAGLETVWGSGSDLNLSPIAGRLTCYTAAGGVNWTYTSPNVDYIMSVEVGDVDGDGINEIAVGLRYDDNMGVLLNANGTVRWTVDVNVTGFDHLRCARIGKLTSDAGNQVLFAGAFGRHLLCDKNGNKLWDKNFSAVTGNASVQWAVIADADQDGTNEIYFAHNKYIRRVTGAGTLVWSTAIMTEDSTPAVMGLAVGKFFTDVAGLQIVGAVAPRGSTLNRASIVWVDKDGNILRTRYLHYDAYCFETATIGGELYLFVGGGSHDTASPPALGWGYVMMLTRLGEPLALFNMPSSVKNMAYGDSNNDGQDELLAACDDGKLYTLRLTQT